MDVAADHLAIQQVLTEHALALDRQDFAALVACYHSDATEDRAAYRGGVSGLLEHLRADARDIARSFHMLGAPWIHVQGDEASVVTYVFAHVGYAGSTAPVIRGLRYLDRLVKREASWRIAHRTVVLDWAHTLTEAPKVPSADTWVRGALGDADPAVAFMRAARP